ncbi:hypothetical protein KAFR_0J02260 [Kazachstania africana CBS 2517]|uniref:Chromatin modification-related protein EAF7 n=1 Tax=Kazachstania africana (strain ATCC 22294 / BCRC 22015 / CBS 2517 / CECT 1963 / NBRC 1671 / NRRL Y-8276) TaxID=1071382 RepID=H2B0Z0_KAZAF|nr:hypothetical protein KAFR_0J02260 [Kazachstania africana CBS 2517]CCF60290.1 hypothetical protein KAFR_0J02260 [Kazachstania africana CBS 2517]
MTIEWSVVDEIRLLRWVSEFKPAGLHKHFHMMCIVTRMNNPEEYPVTLLQKENVQTKSFTADDIWQKLRQYYNLEEADKLEVSAMENSNKDISKLHVFNKKDFALPWDEYGELILENAKTGAKEEEELSEEELVTEASKEVEEVASTGMVEQEKLDTGEGSKKENDKEETLEAKKEEAVVEKQEEKEEEEGIEDGNVQRKTRSAPRIRRSTRNRSITPEEHTSDEGEKSTELKDENKEEPQENNEEVEPQENSEEEEEEQEEQRDGSVELEENIPKKRRPKAKKTKVDEEEQADINEEVQEKPKQKGKRQLPQKDNEPIGARTRHSSHVKTETPETSPKRKKRKQEKPPKPESPKAARPTTRVSSRLRNKK